MDQEGLISYIRQNFIESVAQHINGKSISVRLFFVNDDLTISRWSSKHAPKISVELKLKSIESSCRYIELTLCFDKYKKDLILYTSPKFSIEDIVTTLYKKTYEIVENTFVENNDLITVKNMKSDLD